MKTLYACGDSWMAASLSTPGQHMTEIVAQSLQYELVPLARGGMSNGGICIQIETAIANNADFVLINTTSPDRVEISTAAETGRYHFTTADINYSGDQYISINYPFNGTRPRLTVDSLTSLFDPNNKSISVEKSHALAEYFREIYNADWKRQVDHWCLYASLHRLHQSGIPYVLILDSLRVADNIPWLTSILPFETFGDQAFADRAEFNRNNQDQFQDPGYHTMQHNQAAAAEVLIYYISRTFSSLLPDHSASPP